MATERKLDIFHLLGEINSKNYAFYGSLPADVAKEFSPLVTMRWLSGCSDARQILLLNDTLNRYVFTMGKHPDLLYKVACASNSGKNRRYKWIPTKSLGGAKKNKALDIVMEYYGYGVREAKEALQFLTNQDVLELCEELGYQKDELAAIRKQIRT